MSQETRPPESDLDLMLASLGNPEGAAPVSSPAEILARAASLTPLVVGGLHGWKLAATLGVAVGGGFLGGLLFRGAPEATAPRTTAPEASAQPVETPPSLSPAPSPAASAGGLAALQPVGRPSVVRRDLASKSDLQPRPQRPAPPEQAPELPLASSCPAPVPDGASPALSDDDLQRIDALLPEHAPTSPEDGRIVPTEQIARKEEELQPALAERDTGKHRDDAEDQARVTPTTSHRLSAQVGAGALLGPGAVSGLIAGGGLRRGPSTDQAAGALLGVDLDLGLLTDGMGARWSAGADLSAGRTWRIGAVDLDASWTAGGRLVLPSQADPTAAPGDGTQGAEPPAGPRGAIARNERALLPQTGPKLGLSLGDRDNSRLHLDLAAAVSPGDTILGLQPWFSVSVGSVFPLSGKKES